MAEQRHGVPGTDARVEDPVHRTVMEFDDSRPGVLAITTTMAAGAHLPEHSHPSLEEVWWVTEGSVELKLDGAWRSLAPEDGSVTVARDVRHELRNESGRQAVLKTEIRPPGTLRAFLTESAQAARDGLFGVGGRPRSLRGAAWAAEFALRFRDETVMCSPPPALQKLLLPAVARLTRRSR